MRSVGSSEDLKDLRSSMRVQQAKIPRFSVYISGPNIAEEVMLVVHASSDAEDVQDLTAKLLKCSKAEIKIGVQVPKLFIYLFI